MNSQFKAQLLKSIATKKKNNEGFTLIELLVVVIIIGVLAAIALPNLLGQVGKAREVEAKNLVGTINAAQQARFTEKGDFVTTVEDMEVTVPTLKFYNTPDVSTAGAALVSGADNAKNGTRDYIGAVAYDTTGKTFSTKIGRAKDAATTLAVTDASAAGAGAGTVADISANAIEIK